MADPYAARDGLAAGEQPADPAPARELAARLGGLCAVELAELEGLAADRPPRFIAAVVRDEGPLPPIAAIDAALAIVLLTRAPDGCRSANDALQALERLGVPIFLLKQGLVAGPAGREGAYAVRGELVEQLLEAALADQIVWETDPDFGYRVAARVPGVEGEDADALCPRLLYAAADRVYEHAEAVAAVKRERRRRIELVPGADPRLLAASGWPAEPTGSEWKD